MWLGEPSSPITTDNSKVALFGMFALLGTGLITTIGQIVVSRIGRGSVSPRSARTVVRQLDAQNRFLIARDLDPRKIKTGYETDEEVRLR